MYSPQNKNIFKRK